MEKHKVFIYVINKIQTKTFLQKQYTKYNKDEDDGMVWLSIYFNWIIENFVLKSIPIQGSQL